MGVTTISLPHDVEVELRRRAKERYGNEKFVGKVIAEIVRNMRKKEELIATLNKMRKNVDYDPDKFSRESLWSRQ